ncbi:hypothetical protein GW750_02920 [bacterium]|nr:hypothetical protein [bacterium]
MLLQEDFLHTKSLQDDYLSDLIIIKLNLLAILHTFRPQREILSELNK